MSDLISRNDIEWHDYLFADGNGLYRHNKVAYKSEIDMIPSAQPERKKGKWIKISEFDQGYQRNITCSKCKKVFSGYNWEYNFCPNCGADMRGKEDEKIE